MLVYPTIKEAPFSGISGMGGGSSGLGLAGAGFSYPTLADGNPWSGAWTGYAGSNWSGSDYWNDLGNSSNYGGDGGGKGKSTTTENFGSSVTFTGTANCSGTFNACHRGADGWCIKASADDMYFKLDGVHNNLSVIHVTSSVTQTVGQPAYSFNNPSVGDIIGPGRVFWFNFSSGQPGQGGLNTISDAS